MKALSMVLILSLLSVTALAMPSRAPAPILGEVMDSGQRQPTITR